MKKHRISQVLVFIAILALAVWFAAGIGRVGTDAGEEGRRQLETALRRGAVACYASEGCYPPSLDYLTQHYGVQVDQTRYTVHYEVFAQNLMPQITVLQKGT